MMSQSLFVRFGPFVRLAAAVAGAAMAPLPAAAVVIAPGQSMQATFAFPSAPSLPANEAAGLSPGDPWLVADVLEGILTSTSVSGFGAPEAEIQLFNGSTLLGTVDTDAGSFNTFAFVGPGSVFNFHSAGVSDFTSIQDGSIEGVIRVTNISTPVTGFGRPAPTYDLSISSFLVGHANGPQQFLTFGPDPVIGEQTLVGVAEPGIVGLFTLAVGGMVLVRRGVRGGACA